MSYMTDLPPLASGHGEKPRPSGTGRDYLIRSEEQLQVRTDRVVSGYARLEKFVVTETRTITVEVSHEEFRLVRNPPTDPGAAPLQLDATGQNNSADWLYLSREEVLVTKRVVPLERIRLEVFPVTDQRTITEPVRKERLDLGDLATDPAPPA